MYCRGCCTQHPLLLSQVFLTIDYWCAWPMLFHSGVAHSRRMQLRIISLALPAVWLYVGQHIHSSRATKSTMRLLSGRTHRMFRRWRGWLHRILLVQAAFSGPFPGIAEEEPVLLLPSALSPRTEVACHWQPRRR